MNEFDLYNFQCRNIFPPYLDNRKKSVSESHIIVKSDWKPPINNGLSNSENIIPNYYLTNKCSPKEIFVIDYYSTIEDSIKNLRQLTFSQKEYLKNNIEKQLEIILLYDKVLETLIEQIE
jgi:hypothetical protein